MTSINSSSTNTQSPMEKVKVVEFSEQSEEIIETTGRGGGFDTSRFSGTTQPPSENLRLSSIPSGMRNISRQPVRIVS